MGVKIKDSTSKIVECSCIAYQFNNYAFNIGLDQFNVYF